jgi:branched-chain amino acid aminotransferase
MMPVMKVFLDGQMIEEADARLGAFDAGVQHAVGLFETMRAYHGTVFRLDRHIERLLTSAAELGLTQSLRPGPLREAVELTLAANELDEARIRLTVTGGDMSMVSVARGGAEGHQPTILIAPSQPTV